VTIAYPGGRPLDLVAVVTGCVPPTDVHFHYRVFPIREVPLGKRELQGWLYGRYLEKEEMLGAYYASGEWTGAIPPLPPATLAACKQADLPVGSSTSTSTDSNSSSGSSGDSLRRCVPRRVEQDLLRVILLHGFWLASTGLHCLALGRLYSSAIQQLQQHQQQLTS
jgi:hypothetical protein